MYTLSPPQSRPPGLLVRSLSVVGALLLALLLCLPSAAIAADNGNSTAANGNSIPAPPLAVPPLVVPPPELVTSPELETPLLEEKSFTDKMIDFGKSVAESHEQLEKDILVQVMRLDDFFGGVQTEGERQAAYVFRLRSGVRFEEGGVIEPNISVRLNLVLPKTSKKLRLVISGEDQTDSPSPALPEDPGNPGFDRIGQPTARVVNTEFRYEFTRKPDRYFFVGAGVKVALPMVPFIRGRYQYTHHFSKFALIRLGETVYMKESEGVGETTEITLERLLDQKTLLRLGNSGTLSEEFSGLEWGSELSWIRELTPKSALTFTGGIYGNTRLVADINNYRLLSRYRRNFLKEWLFYEVEPEVTWPRNGDGSHSARYALTFRLEILFAKAAGN